MKCDKLEKALSGIKDSDIDLAEMRLSVVFIDDKGVKHAYSPARFNFEYMELNLEIDENIPKNKR